MRGTLDIQKTSVLTHDEEQERVGSSFGKIDLMFGSTSTVEQPFISLNPARTKIRKETMNEPRFWEGVI